MATRQVLSDDQNEALRGAVKALVDEKRSQASVARLLGVTNGALSQFLSGKTGASRAFLSKVSVLTGRDELELVGENRENLKRAFDEIEAAFSQITAIASRRKIDPATGRVLLSPEDSQDWLWAQERFSAARAHLRREREHVFGSLPTRREPDPLAPTGAERSVAAMTAELDALMALVEADPGKAHGVLDDLREFLTHLDSQILRARQLADHRAQDTTPGAPKP